MTKISNPETSGKKSNSARSIREKFSANSANNLKVGYIHIPKTAGTKIGSWFEEIAKKDGSHPVKFNHAVKAEEALAAFPDMKLCIVLRDPLKRIISGFNSRLRNEAPDEKSYWRPGEATAFSIFRNIESFISAIPSDDPFLVSAVDFAFRNITHLSWSYSYYFGSPNWVRRHADRFAVVGNIDDMPSFVAKMQADWIVLPKDAKVDFPAKNKTPSENYNSPYKVQTLIDKCEYIANEYAIYYELQKLENCGKLKT